MAEEMSGVNEAPSPEQRLVQFFAGTRQKSAPEPAQQPEAEEVTEEVSQQPEGLAAAETEQQADESTDARDEQVSDEVPEGYVELEHLGKKWNVPQELKEAFESNRKMATQQAQEFAPVRRAFEVEKLAMQAAKAADAELGELTSQLAQLNSYKEQAKKLDWTSLTMEQKFDLSRELDGINEQIGTLDKQISAKREAARGKFGQFVTQAVMETEKYMASRVPSWNTDRGKALHEYGVSNGIPVEKLTTGWFSDPIATHIMWKAQQWDSLQAAKPSVANKARAAPPVIKPASNQVQRSVQQSGMQKAREQLRKSGSVEDAARLLMRMK